MKQIDLTKGSIAGGLWAFALPLMLGNIFQQLYNLVDTWVVGQYVGSQALAAVGTSYTLMTFLTSVIIGLCMGSSTFLSICFGRKDAAAIRNGIYLSFMGIGALCLLLLGIVHAGLRIIIRLLQVPAGTSEDMYTYLFYVVLGFFAVFLYNYAANVMRGLGNSVIPLVFLLVSVVLNICLDLLFVAGLGWGIRGAAQATVIAQYAAGIGICLWFLLRYPEYRVLREDRVWNRKNLHSILSLSGYTSLQQSVMNFGILLVQRIVNGFGTPVMAAFAVACKIDTIAYMPAQDFGNAFSVFVAQNFGAGQRERIHKGIRQAVFCIIIFCLAVSTIIWFTAEPLMGLFVDDGSTRVIAIGVQYLRIEGACYLGIGMLFLLYGFYRAVNFPQMSVLLTICSLGTRVVLAYYLSRIPAIGVVGIWVSIPIGWALADLVGIACYLWKRDPRWKDVKKDS